MRKLTLITAVVATLASVSDAAANSLQDRQVGTTKSELLAQRDYSTKVIRSITHSWKPALRHATCWSRVPWKKTCDQARRTLFANRWLRTVAVRKLQQLYPRPQLGHLAGWLCIHSREGAWNSDTGNGFYGGLQMTFGWAGRVGNAALLSPHDQIAAAEAEAALHGWSWQWMQGQWPNTFPPCAGYF